MALQPNKTTGKAVAQVKAMYFLHHENGEEPVIIEVLDSAKWFPVLTLRGTVNVGQDAASIEKILVDQFDTPIGITTEPGDFTFEAQLPSLDEDDLKLLLGEDVVEEIKQSGSPVTVDGRQLVGLDLDGRIYEMSVMIKTATGATMLFSNCQVTFTFGQDGKVFFIRCNGQVLAPSNEANKMIYIATKAAKYPVTGITLNKSSLSLAAGEDETLEATVAPSNASNKKVTWASSDETVATVDASGNVEAVAAGSANITATSVSNPEVSATCAVTVTNA